METPILITSPHGAQALRFTESGKERAGNLGGMGNQLFTLKETFQPMTGKPPAEMTFTGEELDSLAALWIEWRKSNP